MSRKMEYQLVGKSDVEQVVGRAKKSMQDFGRQVDQMGQAASKTPVSNLQKNMEGIANRFKMAGKDLFLSFFGPMVLLNTALNFISRQIEERRQQIEDAKKFAEESESKFLRPEVKELARQRKERETIAEEKRLSQEAMNVELTDALMNKMMSMEMIMEISRNLDFGDRLGLMLTSALGENFQRGFISDIIKFDPQKRQMIMDLVGKDLKAGPTTTASQEKFTDAKAVSGNVIGVGQSPVIDAMNQQTDLLRSIDAKLTPAQPALTPDPNLTNKAPAPSRAGLLMGR